MSFKIYAGNNEDSENDSGSAVITKPRVQIKVPKMFRVLLHNDDFTPMEFVVHIIEQVFNKSRPQAEKIMLDVHHKGIGICGIYPLEIAETKSRAVQDAAKENEYPLLCTCEEDD